VRGSKPLSVSLGYYDNDTLIDIAVTNTYDSSVSVYLGTGQGLFLHELYSLLDMDLLQWLFYLTI
jgi:hypothetical protein